MKFYGIMNAETKQPLGFFTRKNEGGDCTDVEFMLEEHKPTESSWHGHGVWLIASKKAVESVLTSENTPWYNADVMSPSIRHDVDRSKLKVFEVEIK